MRATFATALCALLAVTCNIPAVIAQQYMGDIIDTPGGINNTLGWVPGAEITYWNIKDPNKKNATLINYSSLDQNSNRLVTSNVQRVVIFVHGLDRNGGTYMSNMLSAMAQIEGRPDVSRSNVQIVCPVFPNGDDKNITYPWTSGLAPGKGSTSTALVWQGSGWIEGADAQYPTNRPGVSTFLVLDQMVQYYDNKTLYPNLKQIVVAGHSAGGQNVHRYAAIGKQLNTKTPVSYWIANPNSYAWFSTDRPLDTSSCSIYDNWKEGLSNYTNTYANTTVMNGSDAGRAAVLANYNSKNITYVRGLLDLGDDSSDCRPLPQGANRNERFFYFIKRFPGPVDKTSIDYVNIGHDAGATMASSAGQARLFLDNFSGNNSRAYDFGCPRQQDGDNPNPDPTCSTIAPVVDQGTYNNFTYAGCYADNTGGRALPEPMTLTNTTIDSCTAACGAAGYKVAGVEYADECYCGMALSATTPAQLIEASCTMACEGNSSQICGGPNRLSVFSIGNVTFDVKPVSPAIAGAYKYSGCYVDTGSRVLQGASQATNDMTVEKCAAFCGTAGSNAFGVEYTTQCYCGDTFVPSSSLATASDCDMACGGNSSELCGGPNRLNVYAINATMLTAGGSASSTTSSTTTSATSTATTTSTSATSTSSSLSCPGSDKTSFVSNGTALYAVECYIDHAGGDLSSASVSSFSACIDACTSTTGCIDVSFVPPNNCYMKNTLQTGVTASNVWGARFVSAVAPNATTTTSSSSSSSSSSSAVTTSSMTSSSTTITPVTNSTTSSSSSSTSSSAITTASMTSSSTTTSSSVVPSTTSTSSSSSTGPATSSSSSSSANSVSSSTSSSSTSSSTSSSSTSSSTSSSSVPTTSSSSSSTSSATTSSSSSTSSATTSSSSSTTSSATTSSSSSTTSSATTSSSSSTTSSLSSTTSSSSSTTSSSSIISVTAQATTLSTITTTTSSSSSSSSTSSTIPLPTGYSALGCYTDGNTRTLPYQAYSNSSNTPSFCASACTALGYQFSGTEYTSECWCGSSLPSLTTPTASASDCNMLCSGDKTQRCGAGNRLSVVENTNATPFGVPLTYGNWTAYGCMSDDVSNRTLSQTVDLKAYGGASNATIENALLACAAQGFTWCGAEYYSEVYGAKKAPDASFLLAAASAGQPAMQSAGCNYRCNGNTNEACGGSNRVVVYSLSS